jgi:hypothetical protein
MMTWDELASYARGHVSFVASVRPNGDVVIQGIDDQENTKKIPGQFLRVDFGKYWVCNPTRADDTLSPLNSFQYKERMRAWLEQIPMHPAERAVIVQAFYDVGEFDQPAFTDFLNLLLTHPVTEHEIRLDLIDHFPDAVDIADLLQNAKNLLAKPKSGKGGKGGKNRSLH